MINAYHVIFGAYGFWLPNDPRGSWSDFVGNRKLLPFGKATQTILRHELTEEEDDRRQAAKQALKYRPVSFSGQQALSIGQGFARRIRSSHLTVWSAAILRDHVHLVLARHRYSVEQMANVLKGEATKQLKQLKTAGVYPPSGVKSPSSPWARGEWVTYLDTEVSIRQAIQYVEQNPAEAGLRPQRWSFVTRFSGVDEGNTFYH